MRIALAALAVSLLLPAPVGADGVVIARATDQRGGRWNPCGYIFAVGWVVYDLVRVVEGEAPGPRFVGIHACPSRGRLQGELRLTLRTRRPPRQPAVPGAQLPAGLPRFHVAGATPEAPAATRGARRWLGLDRPAVEGALHPTGVDGDWVQYGPHLALRYVAERVVALRAQVALGMTCEEAAAWLGYGAGRGRGSPVGTRTGCEWPGGRERHRLEAGVGGRLQKGWFDLWRLGAVPGGASP